MLILLHLNIRGLSELSAGSHKLKAFLWILKDIFVFVFQPNCLQFKWYLDTRELYALFGLILKC